MSEALEQSQVYHDTTEVEELDVAAKNRARKTVALVLLRSDIGVKQAKGRMMRPKQRAGRPATGKGEWRMHRKAKAAPQPKQPKKQKDGRQR